MYKLRIKDKEPKFFQNMNLSLRIHVPVPPALSRHRQGHQYLHNVSNHHIPSPHPREVQEVQGHRKPSPPRFIDRGLGPVTKRAVHQAVKINRGEDDSLRPIPTPGVGQEAMISKCRGNPHPLSLTRKKKRDEHEDKS